MPKIVSECSKCGKKNVQEKKCFNLGKSKYITLDCGHTYKVVTSLTTTDSIELLDGKKLYNFQVQGVHFAELSKFSCLIADEQGLGKTIQATGILHLHLDELKPVLIVVKASLTIQWQKHILTELEKFAQIIDSKNDPLPNCSIFITSWDMVGKIDFGKIKIKTIVLDECQMMKNHDAKRTNAIRALITSHGIENKIALSGTPVENNAIEYWPVLNLLRAELFPNRKRFCDWEVGYYVDSRGKYRPGGIKYPKQFKEKTKDFIIRRLKKEVLPDLPTITRDFRYHEINADEMKAYSLGVKRLEDFITSTKPNDLSFHTQLQGHIMILRHITGLAKINPILEYIDEWIINEQDSDRKIAIFHHHTDVGDILEKYIKEREVGYFRLISSMDASERQSNLDNFRNNRDCRIMIAPSLASGTGYDLEFADTGIMLEREWNPSKEGQVEGRFIRATPESIEKAKKGELKATMVYPIAINTIDEWSTELIERKRQSVDSTLDGTAIEWNETDVMMELAKITIAKWKNRS